MPRATKTTKPAAAAEEQTALPIEVEATAVEATAVVEQPAELQTTAADSTVIVMPDPAAPAINAGEPDVSFKIDFSDRTQWYASDDGGKSKHGIGDAYICGSPLDLALQLSKASWGDGYDQRLRLAFQLPDGQGIGELNINAINRMKDGTPYVTSPARSLVGGLLAISEAAEDMESFCAMTRFSIRPGRGKGVFIDVDIACNGRWVAMASAGRTNQIAKDPAGFHNQLALIKSRFRGESLLLTAGAVVGDIAGYDSDLRLLESAS